MLGNAGSGSSIWRRNNEDSSSILRRNNEDSSSYCDLGMPRVILGSDLVVVPEVLL